MPKTLKQVTTELSRTSEAVDDLRVLARSLRVQVDLSSPSGVMAALKKVDKARRNARKLRGKMRKTPLGRQLLESSKGKVMKSKTLREAVKVASPFSTPPYVPPSSGYQAGGGGPVPIPKPKPVATKPDIPVADPAGASKSYANMDLTTAKTDWELRTKSLRKNYYGNKPVDEIVPWDKIVNLSPEQREGVHKDLWNRAMKRDQPGIEEAGNTSGYDTLLRGSRHVANTGGAVLGAAAGLLVGRPVDGAMAGGAAADQLTTQLMPKDMQDGSVASNVAGTVIDHAIGPWVDEKKKELAEDPSVKTLLGGMDTLKRIGNKPERDEMLGDALDTVKKDPTVKSITNLTDAASGAGNFLSGAMGGVGEYVTGFMKNPLGTISSALEDGDWMKLLPILLLFTGGASLIGGAAKGSGGLGLMGTLLLLGSFGTAAWQGQQAQAVKKPVPPVGTGPAAPVAGQTVTPEAPPVAAPAPV